MQISGDYRVQQGGFLYHSHCHSINQYPVTGDLRVFRKQSVENLIPENHAVTLRITLRNHGETLAGPRTGCFECEAHGPLNARLSVDCNVSGDRVWRSHVGGAPLAGVFSLAILADNDPVNVVGAASSKRRLDSGDDVDWPNVDVLIKLRRSSYQSEVLKSRVVIDLLPFGWEG